MALTEVGLVNDALVALGQNTLISLGDDSREGRAANKIYASVRDGVLRAHLWNSASKRATLNKLSTAPDWGFTAAFQLPNDFIRLDEIEDRTIQYAIEGDQLLSNTSIMKIVYIFRQTEVPKMDEGLKQAISAKLAAELSVPLTGSQQNKREFEGIFRDVLAEARFLDSTEGPIERFQPVSWLLARRGRGSNQPFRGIDTS